MFDEDSAEAMSGQVAPLRNWERVVSSLVGFIALGGGVAAIFISTNSLGTGVLLAVGAVFGMMGITGMPIVRAKFGDIAFEMARVAQRAMDLPNPIVRREVASIVLDSALPLANPVRRQAEELNIWAQFESQVIAALVRVSGTSNVHVESSDHRVDAIVQSGQKRIGVEMKLITHSGSVAASQAVNRAAVLLTGIPGRDLDGILIVVNRASAEFSAMAQQYDQLRIVVWSSPADDEALRVALADLSR